MILPLGGTLATLAREIIADDPLSFEQVKEERMRKTDWRRIGFGAETETVGKKPLHLHPDTPPAATPSEVPPVRLSSGALLRPMGLCGSSVTKATLAPHAQLLKDLLLTQGEGARLLSSYKRLLRNIGVITSKDLDIGQDLVKISEAEFCEAFKLDDSVFTRRCFAACFGQPDLPGGKGRVSFDTFIRFAWRTCATDKQGLTAFAFWLYAGRAFNTVGATHLGLDDVTLIARETYDMDNKKVRLDNTTRNTTEYRIEELRKKFKAMSDKHGRMTPELFVEFTRKNSLFLFPAFKLQRQLALVLQGQAFWTRIADRRKRWAARQGEVANPYVVAATPRGGGGGGGGGGGAGGGVGAGAAGAAAAAAAAATGGAAAGGGAGIDFSRGGGAAVLDKKTSYSSAGSGAALKEKDNPFRPASARSNPTPKSDEVRSGAESYR